MAVRLFRACALAGFLSACGGAPAAPTPTPPNRATPEPIADEAPPTPKKERAAPPSSEDVARGMKALEAGDIGSAKSAFEGAVKKNPKDGDAHFYLGVTLEKSGDKAGAEKHYKEALALRPDLEAAAINLGAMYIEASKHDEALAVTQKALGKQPKNASLLTNLGIALATKGDAGAANAFEEATRAAPQDPLIRLTYAQWLRTWKKLDEAAAQLKAAAPHAKDLGTLASIGHEQRLAGAFADCTSSLSKAIEQRDIAELRTDRALCKVGAKDDAGALDDLMTAVKKEPGYGPAHFYLANRLAQGGKFAEAVKEYEAYLKAAPKGDLVKQAEERAKVARERAKKKK